MQIDELVKTVQPYSMATPERLTWMAKSADNVLFRGIPGDFVECGVCNGGSAAILAHFAIPAGRRVHLFDSWQGLPAITDKDTPSFGTDHPASEEVGKCVGSIEQVCEVMRKVGALNERLCPIFFHKGWFQDTFPKVDADIIVLKDDFKRGPVTIAAPLIEQIAMLNLDSDWYESELLCLQTWYDKVSQGGYIYFDDFYYWPGCQQAAKDFFAGRNELPWFHQVGHSAWIKKGEQ